MRTQNIQMNLTQKQLDPILFRTEETGREIEFTLLDPDGTAYDLTDYDLKFSMLKPDGNFIYQDLSAGILTQTEQMTTSRGIGYYAVRVSDQDTLIYTGQGKVVIDDHVITDETLESISEVDGLTFPDDFLTVDDHVAVIDDDVTSTDTTWSSSKINDEIENASVIVSKTAEGNPIELTDAADAPLVKCVTAITGYQSGTGTPSPDNIRPITAYTNGDIEITDGDGNTTTHTTTYPSAIYRGSEDVVNGTETHDMIAVDLGDLTWTYNSNNDCFQSSLSDMKVYTYPAVPTNWKCSCYDVLGAKYLSNMRGVNTGSICPYSGYAYVLVKDTRYTDATTFTTAIAGQTLACELATPTTSSVTPTNLPIKSLSGYTHIESSTGEMEIEYITHDYQPLVDSIEKESESRTTKLWDAGFTPAPGVWLEYDFGEDLEEYDAIVILFVVSGWEGNNSDSVTVYPKMQHLNTNKYYHYIKGTDYGIQFWRVSGTTYGLGSIDGNYPPQYKAVYGIKY